MARKTTRTKSNLEATPTIEQTQQAIEELDRVFHEKARLAILTCLVAEPDPMEFKHLKQLCALTDGKLNRHLKVLLDAGVVKAKKTGSGRTTKSTYSLTPLGRKSFENYIVALQTIVQSARPASDASGKKSQSGDVSFA